METSQQHITAGLSGQVALITGAAHRIGAAIAQHLHDEGMNLVLHYRHSHEAACRLQEAFNTERSGSTVLLKANLCDSAQLAPLVKQAAAAWGRLDVLINNASSFYPTKFGSVTDSDWNDLIDTNLKAPFFLCQAAAPHLQAVQGRIVNIADIHADRPLKTYPVYSIAKAGLVMLTKAMARELGPVIRVNAVAPGAILWPDTHMDESTKQDIITRTALKRRGQPEDIANAITFLIRDADYMTGQVITVDGGRSLAG